MTKSLAARVASTPPRAMYYDGAYATFGEPYAQNGTADLSFTGMNQDTVANLYDFPAREYGTQGRWPSPDPAGIASVHIKDPQSWNRYGYVGNNPLAVTDATGMEYIYNPDGDFGGGGGCDPSDPFCGGGGCDLFCQASNGLSDWMAGGIAPDPSQMGPTVTGQSEFDALENPCSGECRHTSIITTGFDPASGDPCVYSNDDGSYNVDPNSSPKECGKTGGTWVPPGYAFNVSSTGIVTYQVSQLTGDQCNLMNRGLFWLGIGVTIFPGSIIPGIGNLAAAVTMAGLQYYVNQKLCGGPGFFSN